MRKEDFFEVLGELDDDIVKGAESAGSIRVYEYAICVLRP